MSFARDESCPVQICAISTLQIGYEQFILHPVHADMATRHAKIECPEWRQVEVSFVRIDATTKCYRRLFERDFNNLLAICDAKEQLHPMMKIASSPLQINRFALLPFKINGGIIKSMWQDIATGRTV